MNHKKSFLILFTIFFLCIQASQSLTISLRPPKMILRLNITPGEITTQDSFLEIKNYNNETMTVTFEPTGDMIGLVELEQTNITLQPNQMERVNFTVRVSQPGEYKGGILASYSSPKLYFSSSLPIIAG